MANTFVILLKKELKEALSAFTGRKKSVDPAGGVLSVLLAVAIIAFVCLILDRFASMYVGIEVNRVSDPAARAFELLTFVYAAIIIVNALSGIRTINNSLFVNDDMRIFITLPVKSGVMYATKMTAAYVKQFVFAVLTVIPVNVTVSIAMSEAGFGAEFWGLTAPIVFLLPLISLGLGSVFAIPFYFLKKAVQSRYVVTLVIVTAVTGLIFWGYSAVLGFVSELISTGNVKFFFNAEVMGKIADVTEGLYPAAFFADMLLGRGIGAAFGYALLVTAGLAALGVLVGRLLLVPAAQDRYSSSGRHVYAGKKLAVPRSAFRTLLKKEFMLVLRTPSYAFQYFSTAIIMPLMVYFCMDIFSTLVGTMVFVDCNLEIAIFLIVMFGILTNTFCATNISRDGEFFFTMKTMPVNWREAIRVKIFFCFIVSALSVGVSVAVIGGLGYISAVQSLYVLAVTLVISFAQICFATRKDFNHPRFSRESDGEIRESNTTVSVLIIIGLVVSFFVGFIALYSGMYLKLQKGDDFGAMVSMVSVAAVAAVLAAVSVIYLLAGLDKKYYELSEGSV